MGYEFHVPVVTVNQTKDAIQISVEVENRGVAPFYYDWRAEYGLIANGKVVSSIKSTGKLTGLLPGTEVRIWKDAITTTNLAKGSYVLALRIPNAMPKGLPLRFANETQDRDLDGWLTLTRIEHR